MDSIPVLLKKEKVSRKLLVFGVLAKISIEGRLYRAGLLYVSSLTGYLSLSNKIYISLRSEGDRVEIGNWQPLRIEDRAYRLLSDRDRIFGVAYSPISSHLRLSVKTGSQRISPNNESLRLSLGGSLREKVIDGLLRI